jgi:hypothetical protein
MTEQVVSCPCGAATLKITAAPLSQFYCHCADCRRIHGAAYAPEALYPARAVSAEGETISYALKTTPRVSCAKCGARLYADLSASKLRGVNGVLLPNFKADFHMHCSEALMPVVDALAHYAKQPPAFGGEDACVDW